MTELSTKIHVGDARQVLKQYPDGAFNLIVTSPPYADARKKHYASVRPEDYAEWFLTFSSEFKRVLASDGSFVLNLKDKVVNGVRNRYVWRTIDALAADGWRCVEDYIWKKTNSMPGFWNNRLRDEWEYCFHLTTQRKFAMFQEQVKRPVGPWAQERLKELTPSSEGRHNSENGSGFGRDVSAWVGRDMVLPGNVLQCSVVSTNVGHPAAFPVGIPEFFIKLFTQEGDSVLDPFAGSGSTGVAAEALGRNATLVDLSPEYVEVLRKRLEKIPCQGRERYFD